MVSHMTHKSHVKFISFNATIHCPEIRGEGEETAFKEQRAVALVKSANDLQGCSLTRVYVPTPMFESHLMQKLFCQFAL